MPTKLDRLLDAIAPERTLDAVAIRVDAALYSFHVEAKAVESWDQNDLNKYLALFFQHMDEVALFGRPLGLDPEGHLWSHAYLLELEYGPQWHRVVLKIVRTGAEGGLDGVLRALARRLVTKWAESRIGSYICEYWESLTDEERQAAPREYLDKYGAGLPADVRNHRFLTVWFLFPAFLEQYPYIIQRARPVGR